MSMSLFAARTAVAGALGAGALSGAMLFGACPLVQADSAPAPAPTATPVPATAPTTAPGDIQVAPVHHHSHGGIHAFDLIG